MLGFNQSIIPRVVMTLAADTRGVALDPSSKATTIEFQASGFLAIAKMLFIELIMHDGLIGVF